jgi:hypothetical protein
MSKRLSKSLGKGWEVAIMDAQKKIDEAQAKVRQLRKSIAMFRQLRDADAPFPKSSEKPDTQ